MEFTPDILKQVRPDDVERVKGPYNAQRFNFFYKDDFFQLREHKFYWIIIKKDKSEEFVDQGFVPLIPYRTDAKTFYGKYISGASNLKREIAESIPDIAPDIFFVSINKDDKERLTLFITTLDQNAIVEFQPVISASFVSLNSVPIDTIIQPNNNSAWVIEGDRRISWYDNPQTANPITCLLYTSDAADE